MLDSDTEIHQHHDAIVELVDGKKTIRYVDPLKGPAIGPSPTSVTMQEQGCALTLLFDPERAFAGDAELLEIRLTPPTHGRFQPWRVMPSLPRYTQYARASLRDDADDAAGALQELRKVSPGRRGLPDDFLRLVAQIYESLIAEGEPYPVKTLAGMQSVTPSAASRWITAARDRGFLPTKETEK